MSAADVNIRRLAYADLPQVIGIERRAFPTPWSLAMFVLELSKPAGVCLAAVVGGGEAEGDEAPHGDLAGYLVCSRFEDAWHLMNIAVDPLRRRRGVGRALLARLLEDVGPDARLTLEVRTSNTGAIALYEAFDFRSAGVRRRYYQDNGEDALIMWRTPDGVPVL